MSGLLVAQLILLPNRPLNGQRQRPSRRRLVQQIVTGPRWPAAALWPLVGLNRPRPYLRLNCPFDAGLPAGTRT